MGGYIASIALRATGAACGGPRPASINANFRAVAAFDPVEIEVTTVRETKVATCVRADIPQTDRVVLDAVVWGTDTDAGLQHHTGQPRPDVHGPTELASFTDRLRAAGETEWYESWNRLDYRPTRWIDDWENRDPGEPAGSSWHRFPPAPTRIRGSTAALFSSRRISQRR